MHPRYPIIGLVLAGSACAVSNNSAHATTYNYVGNNTIWSYAPNYTLHTGGTYNYIDSVSFGGGGGGYANTTYNVQGGVVNRRA
jgi:hypothetical protein